MKRIIKSNEMITGNLTGKQQQYMRDINREPTFDPDEKSWNFHKVLKTETAVTPWLISIEGEYFAALQAPPGRRGCERVSFYPADSRGRYKRGLDKMIEKLNLYVDMEAACDEFAKIHYANKLRDEELDLEMEISREAAEYEAENKQKDTK